jgi:hypothetical protein
MQPEEQAGLGAVKGTNTRCDRLSTATECAFIPVGMFSIQLLLAASMTPSTAPPG